MREEVEVGQRALGVKGKGENAILPCHIRSTKKAKEAKGAGPNRPRE